MSEILSPSQTELAALNAIVESMKSVSVAMDAQTQELKSLAGKVDDVQSRVIRLEEAKHGRDIERLLKSNEKLEQRIATVELANATMSGKFQGANTLMSLIHKYLPWAAMLLVAFLAYSGYEFEAKQ